MKHTKGEWKVLWHNYTHFATINTDTLTRICAIEIQDSKQIDEKTANAKLIAAAPELLDACIDTLRILRLKPTNDNLYQRNKLKTLIEKATL